MFDVNLMLKGIWRNEKGLMDLQYFTQGVWGGRGGVFSLKLGYGRHFPVAPPFHPQVLPLLLLFPLSYLPQVLPLPSMPFPQLPRTWTNLSSSGGLQLLSRSGHPSSALSSSPPRSSMQKEQHGEQRGQGLTGSRGVYCKDPGSQKDVWAGPCVAPATNRENSQTDRLCYGFYIVKGNRMYVKLCCCVGKSR